MANQKTQPRRVQGFESLREISDDIKSQFDPEKSWKDTWKQILGGSDTDLSVEDPINHKREVIFTASQHQSKDVKHAEKAPVARKEAAIDHHSDFIRSSERASKQETHEIKQRLQEIMVELQKLVNSSKVLQMEFAGVSVDQAPQQAGEYHLNFFDWLLLTIRQAREKVENSGAWLATSNKKSGKKGGGYWDMFKKHGTSFGLSNERSVATQTG